MSVTVLVVDDHPVVRSGLRAMLSTEPELTIVGEAGSGAEALALVEELRPQVVLCDLRLGEGMDGVAVTAALQESGPAVIILTTYDHDRDILRAVEAGAAGYLLKDAAPDRIVRAVLQAARGESVLEPELAQRIVETMRVPRPTLSERELEVVERVSRGLSNREIAHSLFVSEATVKTHLVHAFAKLGADSRTAAVAKAREAGLLDPPT